MKIVYSEEKTVARMKATADEYAKAKKRRNTVRLINLAPTLFILAICIACAVTNTALPTGTGLLYIAVLLFNIVGTIIADKSVPKSLADTCPAEAWYHVASNEFTVLEIKAVKDNGRCAVAVVLDVDGKETIVDLGTFDIQESPKVLEDTLDLETEIVYVPVPADAAADKCE